MHRPNSTNKAGAVIAAALITLLAESVSAQEIIDPTAPPDRLLQALEQAELQPEEGAAEAPTLNKPVMIVERALDGEWRRHTVINGKVVTTGDETALGTIRTIDSNGVEIADDEETQTRSVVDHTVAKEQPGKRAQE